MTDNKLLQPLDYPQVIVNGEPFRVLPFDEQDRFEKEIWVLVPEEEAAYISDAFLEGWCEPNKLKEPPVVLIPDLQLAAPKQRRYTFTLDDWKVFGILAAHPGWPWAARLALMSFLKTESARQVADLITGRVDRNEVDEEILEVADSFQPAPLENLLTA